MPKDADNIFTGVDDIIGDIGELNDIIAKENEQASLAEYYFSTSNYDVASSVEDLVGQIYETIDGYVGLDSALKIVHELNRYIHSCKEINDDFLKRLGKRNNTYKDMSEIYQYVSSMPDEITNIWRLKKYSTELFNKILSIASKENPRLISSPVVAHMALLRFYIMGTINKITSLNNEKTDELINLIKLAFNASAAVREIELCWSLRDEKILERLHSASASANKIKRDQEKYKHILKYSELVWSYGCELLHSQLINLYEHIELIKSSDKNSALNALKRIAPATKIYGQAGKKIIDTCPCSKASGCPLEKEVKMKKRYDLPVSTK